ncbi:carbon storage regulator CsrA [Paenibacillus sp. SAFN-117]|uniref:carbon storage regulator CsrA n=1 Tax=Paenibacillus sp. SAFN-117 TaxID=3436860 RepID=UPI001244D1FB|nr:carbon storage regulator CsrA [Aneurinibacillus sp. XH2]
MLVLTRKPGESIMLGDDIELTVIGIEGEQIKLGISAPKAINIYRKEVYLNIKESNREAVDSRISIGQIKNLMKKGGLSR